MSEVLTGRPWAQAPWEVVTAPISSNALRIFLAIQLHRRPDGHAPFPSQKRLAEMCHLSTRSVKRTIEELKEAGLLTCRQRRREGGSHSTNEYTLRIPGATGATPPGATGGPRSPGATGGPAEVDFSVGKSRSSKQISVLETDGAGAVVAALVEASQARGVAKVPSRRAARFGAEAKKLLAEGIALEHLVAAAELAAERNLSPSLLPDLVVEVQAPRKNGRYWLTPEEIVHGDY